MFFGRSILNRFGVGLGIVLGDPNPRFSHFFRHFFHVKFEVQAGRAKKTNTKLPKTINPNLPYPAVEGSL